MTNQIIKETINSVAADGTTVHLGEFIRALSGSPRSLLVFGGMIIAAGIVTYCVDSGCGVDVDLECAGVHAGVKIHSERRDG